MDVAELSAEDDAVTKERLSGQGKLIIVYNLKKPWFIELVYSNKVSKYSLLWFELAKTWNL